MPDVLDADWSCPNCGDRGQLMDRPGSKDTCANCFWVVGGRYNDHRLRDFDLTFRQAQRLLHALGEPWHGTPGDLGTRLRGVFDSPMAANRLLADIRDETSTVDARVLDLKFDHPNVGWVLDGQETATVRYEFEHDVQEGDILRLLTPGGRVFAVARATNVVQVPLRHAYQSLQSMGAEHPSTSANDLLDRLRGHYDEGVTFDADVQVIAFELTDVVLGDDAGR